MSNRILIVTYSHSGVTKGVAEALQQKVGGDLYVLQTSRVYDPDMWKADAQSKSDREKGVFPELIGTLPSLANYDTILIGGPVWAGTLANPLAAYLDKVDLAGKTVAGFWTFMDYEGQYGADFAKQCKDAKVAPGLALTTAMLRGGKLKQMLDTWIASVTEA